METIELSVSGMHCGSCSIVIRRTLSKISGVEGLDIRENSVSVNYDSSKTNPEKLAQTIVEKGYSVSAPGIHLKPKNKPISSRINFFFSDAVTKPEREALKIGLVSFVVLAILNFLILRGFFQVASLRTAILVFYLTLTVSALGATLWHFFSFRRQVTCSTGMMVGMTLGMISGFLTGTLVAASNGIFIGTVYGIIAGMLIGSLAGRCCGIMGILEGMMAGLMSGVMGGMIPLMFLSENIMLFLPILTAACLVILSGFVYSIFWENREYQKAYGKLVERKPLGALPFISLSFIIVFLTTILMVLGPKSALIAQL